VRRPTGGTGNERRRRWPRGATNPGAVALPFENGTAVVTVRHATPARIPGTLGHIAGGSGLEAVPVGMVVLAWALRLLHEGLARRPDIGATSGQLVG